MGIRVCRKPGCPEIIDAAAYKGLCDVHRKEHDRSRGTRTERGYDAAHDAERESYAKLIRAGITVRCVTCQALLGLDFHLGHTDDRMSWIGPQCPPCNLSDAGRARHGLVALRDLFGDLLGVGGDPEGGSN